jgi:hypothetical protein
MKSMKGLYLLNASLMAIFSTLPPFIYAGQALAVEAGTLQALPDGSYTVCSDLPKQFPQDKSLAQAETSAERKEREEKVRSKGENVRKEDKGLEGLPITKLINTCFEFSKSGNRVVGMYFSASKTTMWCVSGVATGNAVNGFALSKGVLPQAYGTNSDKPNLNLAEIEPSLKVASISIRPEGAFPYNRNIFQVATVRYNRALLDLSKFYLVNVKPQSPPSSCEEINDLRAFYNNRSEEAQPEYFTDPGK